MSEQQPPQINSLAIPIAIIIGFGMIALAIYFSGIGKSMSGTLGATVAGSNTAEVSGDLGNLNPINADDHIRGNPNAPIVFVEYSDYDCPFCKNFHETMKRILNEYGENGQVAWVYRHFPLEQLHPSAPHIAKASECVATIGGNEAFWTFSDLVFEERETNEQTDTSRLGEFAKTAGIDEIAFSTCLENGETTQAVQEDMENALAIGGKGTPHTVVLVGDQQGVINGAQPYETVRQIVEELLAQAEGSSAGN